MKWLALSSTSLPTFTSPYADYILLRRRLVRNTRRLFASALSYITDETNRDLLLSNLGSSLSNSETSDSLSLPPIAGNYALNEVLLKAVELLLGEFNRKASGGSLTPNKVRAPYRSYDFIGLGVSSYRLLLFTSRDYLGDKRYLLSDEDNNLKFRLKGGKGVGSRSLF